MKKKLLSPKVSFYNLILHSAIAILFALVFTSCSKDEPASTQSNLTNVIISKANNPTLTEDAYVLVGKSNIYVTLPLGADLSHVKLSLKISPEATVSLNGKSVPELTGTFDLSSTSKIIVTSESGALTVYKLLAQTGRKDFDKPIYQFMEKFSIPGVSIAISKTATSEIVYKSGLGFAIVEDEVRTKPNQLFRLGSMSKQFTSISIMKLIQEGKFTVETKVFGPEGILKDDFTNISDRAAEVTIRNLLDHSSGWESDPDPMFSGSFSGQTLNQRIEYVLGSKQNEPGTKFSYFNMGYGILGKVIEKVSGKKFETFLKEVLAEADIHDIHVGGDKSGRRPNEVIYYSQDGRNGYLNEMEVIAAAGGIIASTEELLKLQYYIDGKTNIPDILTPEIRTLMLTESSTDRYALGWRMNHRLFPGCWYHGGNLSGTATFWVMGPDYNCVILCNSRSYKSGFDDEFYYISESFLKQAAVTFK